MAKVDLLNLEPKQISKDLKGKYLMIYSQPKAGKTSLANKFPRNLLLAFEKGYNGLGIVNAVDMETWTDFKDIVRQLKKPEVQARYDTITIDTVSLAFDLCEKWVCMTQGVDAIGDIPYGGGYAMLTKEFSEALRTITLCGVGLILLAHSDPRMEKQADGTEVEILAPSLNKRCYKIANALVDLILYIDVNDDTKERTFLTRKTKTVFAGSRYRYLPERIPFGYDELTQALVDAIEEEALAENVTPLDTQHSARITQLRPFAQAMDEARELWLEAMQNPPALERAIGAVKEQFGSDEFKLSGTKPSQQPLLENVIEELKLILGK